MTLVQNETQQHSAALKNTGQNPVRLLPLYSVNELRRQVVADSADAGNFVGNACSDALQQCPVKLGNFSGHNVNGVDAANYAGRLSGSMQSSFKFGWNASLLARCIFHICYLYPVGNIFPDWVMHLLRNRFGPSATLRMRITINSFVYALSCYLHTRHFPAPQWRL